MLHLIGYGLDPQDLGKRALEALRGCKRVYAELYTNVPGSAAAELEHAIGRPVELLGRSAVEEGTLLDEAAKHDVALVVPGDPLAATTHCALLLEAKKRGIAYRVLHNASVFTAVAESGLQLYKFGKAVTLASPYKGKASTGWYADVRANKERGLHTLLLLDSGTGGEPMSVAEAAALLLAAEHEHRGGVLAAGAEIVALSRLGHADSRVHVCALGELRNAGLSLPAALVLPGELHFLEREFLDALR